MLTNQQFAHECGVEAQTAASLRLWPHGTRARTARRPKSCPPFVRRAPHAPSNPERSEESGAPFVPTRSGGHEKRRGPDLNQFEAHFVAEHGGGALQGRQRDVASCGSSRRPIWLRLVPIRSAMRLRDRPWVFIACSICQARTSDGHPSAPSNRASAGAGLSSGSLRRSASMAARHGLPEPLPRPGRAEMAGKGDRQAA
jgi:hypothetical protein